MTNKINVYGRSVFFFNYFLWDYYSLIKSLVFTFLYPSSSMVDCVLCCLCGYVFMIYKTKILIGYNKGYIYVQEGMIWLFGFFGKVHICNT